MWNSYPTLEHENNKNEKEKEIRYEASEEDRIWNEEKKVQSKEVPETEEHYQSPSYPQGRYSSELWMYYLTNLTNKTIKCYEQY